MAEGRSAGRGEIYQKLFTAAIDSDEEKELPAPTLPPLTDVIRGSNAENEFARLIVRLLVDQAARQGLAGVIEMPVVTPQALEVTGYVRDRPFCGLEPVVAVTTSWREDERSESGPWAKAFGFVLAPWEGGRPNNWVFVTPRRREGSRWNSLVEELRKLGVTAHNFHQPHVEQWLRACPALLARYYPKHAIQEAGGDEFDGQDFQTWKRRFTDAVVRTHRNLHLFGFPDRKTHPSDDPDSVDPRRFLLDDVFVPQTFSPEGKEQDVCDLSALLGGSEPRVLLGGPGSGKTSIVRYLALAYGEGRTVGKAKLDRLTPLFLPLRNFANELKDRPTLLEAMAHHARESTKELARADIHRWKLEGLLEMGEAVVFFDGLDEIVDRDLRRTIANLVRSFHLRYPECPVWLTSRIVGYDEARLEDPGFRHYRVSPFSPGQQTAFIRKWFEAQLPGADPLILAKREQFIAGFHEAMVEAVPETRELAETPLLLTLMAWVHYDRGRLPTSRGDLYEACIDMLLNRREVERARHEGKTYKARLEDLQPPITTHMARRYYADVAWRAQALNETKGREARGIIPSRQLEAWLEAIRQADLKRYDPDRIDGADQAKRDVQVFINHAEERTGLLRYRGSQEYAFAHLSFQEYLAACWRVGSTDSGREQIANFVLEKAPREQWRETLLLLLFRLRAALDDEPFSDFVLRHALEKSSSQDSLLEPNLRHFFGMAARDQQPFIPRHLKIVLRSLLATWLEKPVFEGETFNLLSQISRTEPSLAHPLEDVIQDQWNTTELAPALAALHLRVRLFGWPATDPAEGQRLAAELHQTVAASSQPDLMHRAGELLTGAKADAIPELAECAKLVRDKLAELMVDTRRLPRERAASGIALGQLGDPRPGVGLRPDAPNVPWFEWSRELTTEGVFRMQKGPERRIAKRYVLGIYPVTVVQYSVFTKEGYGVAEGEKPAWWTAAGWEWRCQQNVSGPAEVSAVFETANHPQVGMSWYEVSAYCGWLRARFGPQELGLPDGWEVRLASEAEWEHAASAGGTREYPFAGAVDWSQHGNISETGIGHTSAVGMFPGGMAACGAFDLAGNVWEWCRSVYSEKGEGSEDLDGKDARCLRGGSWNNDPVNARAACRYRYGPGLRNYSVGFRLAASPISEI